MLIPSFFIFLVAIAILVLGINPLVRPARLQKPANFNPLPQMRFDLFGLPKTPSSAPNARGLLAHKAIASAIANAAPSRSGSAPRSLCFF